MASFDLPAPNTAAPALFHDAAGAREWITGQPLVTSEQLEALLGQVLAVDAASLSAAERFATLDVLRSAVVRSQSGLESRYTRKALPPSPEVGEAFSLSRRLWRALSVAYLRPVPLLGPAESAVALHRAAITLRLEQFAHFLGGYEVPLALRRLLYELLLTAEGLGVQRTAVADPDLGFLGDSHIAGHLAWALLLEAIDPYRLSLAQLTVANRGFSRWRELAGFQALPDDDPKARTLLLSRLLPGVTVPEGGPRWLEIRAVVRKIKKRIESLEAGETPESLKLGKELSASACAALLRKLEVMLKDRPSEAAGEPQPIRLAFGSENAYVAIERRPLNPSGLGTGSAYQSHERMAVFGFDNVSNLAGAVARVDYPSESWQMIGSRVVRLPTETERRLAPCLVALASDKPEAAQLGVLGGLRLLEDGCLAGHIRWYFEHPLAARLRVSGPLATKATRIPAFLLPEEDQGEFSLIVPPTAGVRPNTGLALDDCPVEHLLVGEVAERGSDFVRYACRAN